MAEALEIKLPQSFFDALEEIKESIMKLASEKYKLKFYQASN